MIHNSKSSLYGAVRCVQAGSPIAGFVNHWPVAATLVPWSAHSRPGLHDIHASRPHSFFLQATLSSKAFMRGERFDPMNPASLGFGAHAASPSSSSSSSSGSYRLPPTMVGRSRGYSGARAAYGDYPNYPEGRPIFLPEAERFGNPPDLPSLLLQQRVIYISMPVSSNGCG